MVCPKCEQFYKDYPLVNDHHNLPGGISMAPIKCGFNENDMFTHDNWNCQTLIALRELMYDNGWYEWSDDTYTGTISTMEYDLVMIWYKHRGKTDGARIEKDGKEISLSLNVANSILERFA